MYDLKDKRILVTGGAGFIGSELVRQLIAGGSHVTVVDNLANGRRENLLGLPEEGLRLETADIRDLPRMRELLSGMDIVYHLACLGVRHSIHSPVENHEVNATATLHLLQASQDAHVDRFVHVSSSEVYGTAISVPMAEDHPTFPMTVYGGAKLAGEAYARAFYRTYGYPTVVVRPFNTYGPRSHHEGDCGEVIPKFMLRALAGKPLIIFGDGEQTRDFTHVSDTARGIMLCAQADMATGKTLNIGSDHEISINHLADVLCSVTGGHPERRYEPERPGDTIRLWSDSRKAAALLGYEPRMKLEEGLSTLLDWYRQSDETIDDLLSREIVQNWEKAS